MVNELLSRQETLDKLKQETFDVIVIGGGITGAGIARDAALRGLSVALLEKNDFAAGTSSASTKLLHGGLRYLKNYEFGLVREASLEREIHTHIAPHLSEIVDFLVPFYEWNPEPPWLLRIGLILYELLAFPKGIGHHKFMKPKKVIEYLPLLENEKMKVGALYADVKTDDARLVLSNINSARNEGACVSNYMLVHSWESDSHGVQTLVEDVETGEKFPVRGKSLIIAGGPWTELIEDIGKDFDGHAKLRTTWGTHIVLKKRLKENPILILNEDKRAVFIIPRLDYDIAGTTDIDFHGHPDDIRPNSEDVEYLLKACNKLFPKAKYTTDDVVATFIGLRPLVFKKGVSEGKVSRNHTIFADKEKKVVTIAGGKLTTYRVMAQQAIDTVLPFLGLKKKEYRCITKTAPLWGGDIEDWNQYYQSKVALLVSKFELEDATAEMLVKFYGSELGSFQTVLEAHGTTKLLPQRPWLEAQVLFSCKYELARTPIDFLRRRTPIMFEEGNGESIVHRVVELMSQEFGWTDEYRTKMVDETLAFINNNIRVDLSSITL